MKYLVYYIIYLMTKILYPIWNLKLYNKDFSELVKDMDI